MAKQVATLRVRIDEAIQRSVKRRVRRAKKYPGALAVGVAMSIRRNATSGFSELAGFKDLASGAIGPTIEALKAFPNTRILATARAMNQPAGFFRAAAMASTAEGREAVARRAKFSFGVNVEEDKLRLQGMRRFALLSEFAGPGAAEIKEGMQWIIDKGEEIKEALAKKK